ncbi:MAG: hypothetical protein WAK56_13290 [Candidatus Sulfotelmatobacter sp.]
MKIGEGLSEYHLFIPKSHLTLEQYDGAGRIDNERRGDREEQVENGTVPSPELLKEEP